MTVFIELAGPAGSGKTTLAELLSHELTGVSLLLVDASTNRQLTRRMTLELFDNAYGNSLESVLSNLSESTLASGNGLPPKNEAIDWAFHDLPFMVGDNLDLIPCGPGFDLTLPELAQKMLAYGFPRLCADYDVVVLDGFHPALHGLLPADALQVLVSLPDVTVSPLPALSKNEPGTFMKNPGLSLIINRYQRGSLSPVLEELIRNNTVSLIGKIPHYDTPAEREDAMPEAFRNCLLRLDIPLLKR